MCLAATADGPFELHVGERVILPGECLQGPPDGGSGRLGVALHAAGLELDRARLHLRAGTRTTVAVEGERVRVVEAAACDGRVPTP